MALAVRLLNTSKMTHVLSQVKIKSDSVLKLKCPVLKIILIYIHRKPQYHVSSKKQQEQRKTLSEAGHLPVKNTSYVNHQILFSISCRISSNYHFLLFLISFTYACPKSLELIIDCSVNHHPLT